MYFERNSLYSLVLYVYLRTIYKLSLSTNLRLTFNSGGINLMETITIVKGSTTLTGPVSLRFYSTWVYDIYVPFIIYHIKFFTLLQYQLFIS